jgi:hypothetical protein
MVKLEWMRQITPTLHVAYFLDRLHALHRDHKTPDPEVFIAALEKADEKTQLIVKTFLIALEEVSRLPE